MADITKEVNRILRWGGYFEGRKVDISDIIEMYDKYKYNYTDLQKEFLEKYSALEFEYVHPLWGDIMTISLKPIEAQEHVYMSVVESYNKFFSDEFIVIGEIVREDLTLYLSNKGKFYGALDDYIEYLGEDFNMMLHDLIIGKRKGSFVID